MICPSCGTHITDGLLRCPACHADLAMTFVMPRLTERWCASCGVLVPLDAGECPNCGMPAEPVRSRVRTEEAPEAEVQEADEHGELDEGLEAESTRSMARIESAVPAGPDPYGGTAEGEGLPRPRVTLVAALAAILVVGGTVLYITHPWDPSAFSTKATEPADTSMAGFPGSVESLTGQDSSGAANGMTGDEYTYQLLSEAHGSLLGIEERLAASEEALRTTGVSGSAEQREEGLETQTRIAVELSNLIAQVDSVDVTSGTYAEDRENLSTLGNWLRNWSDALTTGWSTSARLDDPSGSEDDVLQPLYDSSGNDGANYYRSLFDQYVEDWLPRPAAGD